MYLKVKQGFQFLYKADPESSIQKFGFINRVDNVNWPPYRDSKC